MGSASRRHRGGGATYEPWGAPWTGSATLGGFGFTGELADADTGLVYLRARHYDPQAGRFLQQDSYGGTLDSPVSQHRYSYVEYNPTTFVDPSGEFAILPVLMAVWMVVEWGFTAYDAYSTIKAWLDPNVCFEEKAVLTALTALGVVGPLGGYGTGFKLLRKGVQLADHHIFPAFRGTKSTSYAEFFRKLGIDVDKYTVTVAHGEASHHLKFLHGRDDWNDR